MSTNDEAETTEAPAEEVSTVDVSDLKREIAEAEAKPQVTETEQVAQSTEPAEAQGPAPEATFTKEVPSIPGETPEEYYKNLERAYQESTKEALRLKGLVDTKEEAPDPEAPVAPVTEVLTPEQLYIRQKQSEEIEAAFDNVSAKYPQLKDRTIYDNFVANASMLGRVIVETQGRAPSPKELYDKTVVILGLQPDNSEQISSTIKDSTGQAKTGSSMPAPSSPSKVTEDMISMNMKMYPNKTRQEIIEELEPHVN